MKAERIDLVGQRFGRLVVLEYSHTNKDRRPMWLCRCDCGGEKAISGKYLRNGKTQSCGCLHRETTKALRQSHGMTGSATHRTWSAMLTRCTNTKQQSYAKYGAKGVKVCERWSVFENFLADMGERPEGMTLDRINPFGNYEPGNCRWASVAEQATNKRADLALAVLQRMQLAGYPVAEFTAAYLAEKGSA